MPNITYIGENPDGVTWKDIFRPASTHIHFPHGQPVTVKADNAFHRHVIAKARENQFFEVDEKGKAVEAKAASGTKDEQTDAMLDDLRMQIEGYGAKWHPRAGIPKLQQQLAELKTQAEAAEQGEEDSLSPLEEARQRNAAEA